MRMIILALLFICSSLGAQEVDAYRSGSLLSLQSCIAIALSNHQGLQIVDEDEKINYATYRIANASYRPTLGLGVATRQINDEDVISGEVAVPGRDTHYGLSAGFNASYDLYRPGRSESVSNARKGVEIGKLDKVEKIRSIEYGVHSAYYTYVLAAEQKRLSKITFDRYSRILRRMSIESQAGQIGPVKLSDWQIKSSQQELSYEAAVQNLEQSRTDLFLAMGLNANNDHVVEVSSIELLPILKVNEEQLIALALSNSISILKASIAVDVARNNLMSARANRYPNLSFFASLGYVNDALMDDNYGYVERMGSDFWTPSLGVGLTSNLPLYSGGSITANIDKSEAAYKKSRQVKSSVDLSVRMNVKKSYSGLKFLLKQIKISKAAVINAQTNLKINERSFESGLVGQDSISDASEFVYITEITLLQNRIKYLLLIVEVSNMVGVNKELICR